jgi:DNA-binding transcriptional LysR family regulator
MFLRELSEFSLQSLRVFSYVASMKSVLEAADAMSLTQPAVSLQIHNLEKQLGYNLFEKQGRRNVLTARGQDLFQRLLPHLERLEQIIVTSKNPSTAKPELRLGSIEGVGEYWLGTRFNDFATKHEGMRLNLDIHDTGVLEERLLTGRISIAITPKKIENSQVVSQVLMDERFLPVGRKKNIAALKEILESAENQERVWEKIYWIGYGDTAFSDPWTLRWLESVGILVDRRFRYHHSVNSYAVIKQLLLEGAGVCVAPEHTCEVELKDGSLVQLESKKLPALSNRLYISYREASMDKHHVEFLDWIKKMGSKK